MERNKDWGLAARTVLALLTYRIGRVWDALLIAVVPIKEALFPARPRPARTMRGGRLGMLAAVGLLRTLHLPRMGATRWTRLDALAVGGALRTKGTSDE